MDGQIRNIVVGIAEIRRSDPHLAPAVALAESLGATLHVVHAYRLPDPNLSPFPEMGVFGAEAVRRRHDEAQRRLEAQVRGLGAGERVVCRVVPVPADCAILEVAREVDADLILVGATRRGALARAVLGTTAQRVVRASPVPVLVKLAPERGAPRRILLTTDLTELGAGVQVRGLEIAAALGGGADVASLLVVGSDVPLPPPLTMQRVAEVQLAAFLEDIGGAAAVEARVRIGDPAREIVAEAARWRADLVVLGTHGRMGTPRLLLGSVAEWVLRHASCDALVIPGAALTAAYAGPPAWLDEPLPSGR